LALSIHHKRPYTMYLLSSVRKYKRAHAVRLRRSPLPVPMLCWIAKGSGNATIDGTVYSVQPQQLWFLPAGSHLDASVTSQESVYYVVLFEALQAERRRGQWELAPLSDGTSPSYLLPPGPQPLQNPQEAERKIEQMYALCREYQMDSASSDDAALVRSSPVDSNLLLQSLVELVLRSAPLQHANRTPDPGLDVCIAYMHEHFQEKISRNTLAGLAKLTPNAFCRSFKRTTGQSPTDYLNSLRIEKAKQLLSPSVSIKEVAVTVGYGSEYYFSRIFKETVGLSPSHFIKRERLRVATASRCGFHENLSSMGMEAVAAVDCYRYPWMNDHEYSRQLLSQLEQLRLAKPDLIIADFAQRSCYEEFKRIAPTAFIEHGLDWRATYRQLAELVGREKEAEQSMARLDESINEAKRLLMASPGNNSSVAVVQILPQRIRVQGTVLHPLNDLIYHELGLLPGSGVPRNKMRDEWLSGEVPRLEADHLFVIKLDTPPLMSGESGTQPPQAIPFDLNPPGHNRKIHLIPNWLVMSWTPQGRRCIAEELVNNLTKN